MKARMATGLFGRTSAGGVIAPVRVAMVLAGCRQGAMLPRAGNPKLTDDEIEAAVEYILAAVK